MASDRSKLASLPTSAPAEVLWNRPVPVTRSDPTAGALQIAEVAIAIADREGLAGLSIKRVAAKARVPVAVLSQSIASKDDLLDLIFDAFYGEIDPPLTESPGDPADSWRTDLRAFAAATKSALQNHAWAVELMGARPPYGPNGLRTSERALAAVSGLGLDSAAMTSAVNAVLAYVCGAVRRQARAGVARTHAGTAQYLLAAVGSGQYPHLAQVFAETQDLTEQELYDAGLEVVLDGIAARVAAVTS